MPTTIDNIADLPSVPAIYAMFGGRGRSKFVAYVGMAVQTIHHVQIHLIPRRDGATPNPRGGVRGVIPDKMSY